MLKFFRRFKKHVHNANREVALTTDCGYGCKIMACPCGNYREISHRRVYGCPLG